MREREAQGCGDCRNNIWCIPEQVRYQLAGGRIEEFLCLLDPKLTKRQPAVSRSVTERNEQYQR
jgi:hypothetical protein